MATNRYLTNFALRGLKGIQYLTPEEGKMWLDGQIKAGRLSKNATYELIQLAFDDSVFLNYYKDSDLFNSYDSKARKDLLMRDAVSQNAFSRRYKDVATPEEWDEYSRLTDYGRLDMLIDDVKTAKEMEDIAATHNLKIDEAKKKYWDVMEHGSMTEKFSMNGTLGGDFVANVTKYQNSLIEQAYKENEEKWNKIQETEINRDLIDYDKYSLMIEDQMLQMLDSGQATEQQFEDDFASISENISYFKAFEGKSELKQFNTREKIKLLAKFSAISQLTGDAGRAFRDINAEMQDYVSDHLSGAKKFGLWAKNLATGTTSTVMADVIGMQALYHFIHGGEEELAEFLKSDYVQYWEGVDTYNTFDENVINDAKKYGVSPYQRIRRMGEEHKWGWDTTYDMLAMAKFVLPALLSRGIGFAAGKAATGVGGSLMRSTMMKSVRKSIALIENTAVRTAFMEMGDAIPKVAKTSMAVGEALHSGVPIAHMYSINTFNETYQENLDGVQLLVLRAIPSVAMEWAENQVPQEVPDRQQKVLELYQQYIDADREAKRVHPDDLTLLEKAAREKIGADSLEKAAAESAAKAYAVNATVETIRMAAENAIFRRWMLSKDTKANLGLDNPYYRAVTENGEQVLKGGFKNFAYPIANNVVGGMWSNYADDLTARYGKEFGLADFNNYVVDLVTPELYVGIYRTYMDPSIRAINGVMDLAVDEQSFWDGFIGGGGALIQVLPFVPMAKFAIPGARAKFKLGNWAQKAQYFVTSPVLQEIGLALERKEQAEKQLLESKEAVEKKKADFEGIASAIASDSDMETALNTGSMMAAANAKTNTLWRIANTFITFLKDPVKSGHPLVQKAQEDIDRIEKAESVEDIADLIKQVLVGENNHKGQSRTDLEIYESLKNNVKRFKETALKIEEVHNEINKHSDGRNMEEGEKAMLTYNIISSDNYRERINNIEEEINVATSAKGKAGFKAGSHTEKNSRVHIPNEKVKLDKINAQKETISEIEAEEETTKEELKALKKEASLKLKLFANLSPKNPEDGGIVAKAILEYMARKYEGKTDKNGNPITDFAQLSKQERILVLSDIYRLIDGKIAGNKSKLKALERTKREAQKDLKWFLSLEVDSESPILSRDEIMGLSFGDLHYMLTHSNEYSQEQQSEIDKVRDELASIENYELKIGDAATMQRMIDTNEFSRRLIWEDAQGAADWLYYMKAVYKRAARNYLLESEYKESFDNMRKLFDEGDIKGFLKASTELPSDILDEFEAKRMGDTNEEEAAMKEAKNIADVYDAADAVIAPIQKSEVGQAKSVTEKIEKNDKGEDVKVTEEIPITDKDKAAADIFTRDVENSILAAILNTPEGESVSENILKILELQKLAALEESYAKEYNELYDKYKLRLKKIQDIKEGKVEINIENTNESNGTPQLTPALGEGAAASNSSETTPSEETSPIIQNYIDNSGNDIADLAKAALSISSKISDAVSSIIEKLSTVHFSTPQDFIEALNNELLEEAETIKDTQDQEASDKFIDESENFLKELSLKQQRLEDARLAALERERILGSKSGESLASNEEKRMTEGRDYSEVGHIESVDIQNLKKLPDGSPTKEFLNTHHVEETLGDMLEKGLLNSDTEVVFLTDSDLAAEVEKDMNKDLKEGEESRYTPNDVPIIAAIDVTDKNIGNPITIDGRQYQPIAIMPATDNPNIRGSSHMRQIRVLALANKTGTLIVKRENGDALTTTLEGAGIRRGTKYDPSPEAKKTTRKISQIIDNDLGEDVNSDTARKGMLANFFLNLKKMVLGKKNQEEDEWEAEEDDKRLNVCYAPPGANPILVKVQPIHKTVGTTSSSRLGSGDGSIGETVPQHVKRTGTIKNFNSRTRRAVAALMDFSPSKKIFFGREEGKRKILNPDEVQSVLSNMELELTRTIGNFINISKRQGWAYKLQLNEETDGDIDVFIVNTKNSEIAPISIGTISLDKITEELAEALILNIILDENGEVRMQKDGINSFAKWQFPFNEIDNLTGERATEDSKKGATSNFIDIYNDDILEVGGDVLSFNTGISRVSLQVPKFGSSDNNNSSNGIKGLEQRKKEGEEKDEAPKGPGIPKEEKAPTSNGLKAAEAAVRRMRADTKEFEIVEVRQQGNKKFTVYQQRKDGKLVGPKRIRVTSLLYAEEGMSETKRFSEESTWFLPSTSIGNTVDVFNRAVFSDEGVTDYSIYPNAYEGVWRDFGSRMSDLKEALRISRNDLTFVSDGITVTGQVEVIKNGKAIQQEVAGTVDLLAYDKDGFFYLYDFKTKRSSVTEEDLAKWREQLSLYKYLLEEKYGITVKEIGIIPINVHYETPYKAEVKNSKTGRWEVAEDATTVYSVKEGVEGVQKNQLYTKENGSLEEAQPFMDLNPTYEVEPGDPNFGVIVMEPIEHNKFKFDYSKMTESEKALVDQSSTLEDEAPAEAPTPTPTPPVVKTESSDNNSSDNWNTTNEDSNELLNFIYTHEGAQDPINNNSWSSKVEDPRGELLRVGEMRWVKDENSGYYYLAKGIGDRGDVMSVWFKYPVPENKKAAIEEAFKNMGTKKLSDKMQQQKIVDILKGNSSLESSSSSASEQNIELELKKELVTGLVVRTKEPVDPVTNIPSKGYKSRFVKKTKGKGSKSASKDQIVNARMNVPVESGKTTTWEEALESSNGKHLKNIDAEMKLAGEVTLKERWSSMTEEEKEKWIKCPIGMRNKM